MKENDLDVLQKPKDVQFSIALTSTSPDVLDSLADSPNDLVRMTAVSNSAVSTETLERKLNDEDVGVRWKAYESLQKRDNKDTD